MRLVRLSDARKGTPALRRRIVLILTAVVLATCVEAATLALPAWIGPRLILAEGGNSYGLSNLHVHRPVSIAFFFENRTGTSLTVTKFTLSHPLSPHLKVLGEAIRALSPGTGSFLILPGRVGSSSFAVSSAIHAVRNFHLLPHQAVEYVLTLESNAPSVFTIQGVTMHARYPLPFGALPVQVTNRACAALGVGTSIHGSCSGLP